MVASDCYEEKIASELESFDAEIEHLKARTDLLLVNIEERYYDVLRGLRVREEELRESLKVLHTACDCTREDARLRVERATAELKRAIEAVPPELA